MSRFAVGVDLGGTKIEVCLIDETRKILGRRRMPSEASHGREKVIENILRLIDDTSQGRPYKAVGMGTPGTYHPGDDIMHGAPHTPLYERPGLVRMLREKLSVPLIIENDANCLALAEFFEQCSGRYASIMAVILGTGVGSGLILNNKLYRGPNGNAGEIGHATIDINGRLCECGRIGCAEAYLSGPSLSRRYKDLSGETLAPKDIYARYEQGEAAAVRLFEESIRIMGEVFANVVNILDIEAVILGGGVSNIPLWYDHVPPVINRCLFGIRDRRIPVLRAKLGDSAGVLGAAFLALREMRLMDF